MIGFELSLKLATNGRLEELRRQAREYSALKAARRERQERSVGAAPQQEPRFTWELPSQRSTRKRAWYARLNPAARRHAAPERSAKLNDPA